MDNIISDFIQEFNLSRRETEVFELLTQRHVTISILAEKLDVSSKTIENHLNNIYKKTDTHSKTELLSFFIIFSSTRLKSKEQFFKPPKVLIVDDEFSICRVLKLYLEKKGLSVIYTTEPMETESLLEQNKIDCVISDIKMPKIDGFELLSRTRSRHPFYPTFLFITGYSKYLSEELYEKGAQGFFKKPINHEQLFYTIMKNYIEDTYEFNRTFRIETRITTTLNLIEESTLINIGIGGAFIGMAGDAILNDPKYQIGSNIELLFKLDTTQNTIKTVAEIVWTRPTIQTDKPTGIGVKFSSMSDEDKKNIHDFVKMNKILSFIPLGA